MPCTASDNTLNPIVFPGIPVPGFGIPFSPIQTPQPSFDLPTELVEDLVALMNQLQAIFPSGIFKANTDLGMKTVLDFIANILTQIAPFMSFYNFIMSALNLIICIIEVLCAIPNPLAMIAKLKKLFTECLPPFLNLFPWSALAIMVISLLLLIIALIDYLITTVIQIIDGIVKNLQVLSDGITLQDAQSTLAATQKIAALLCFIQNVLSILTAIGALISIIQALGNLAGGSICSNTDPNGCCPPELCPDFIRTTPNGITTKGKLYYHRSIETDVANVFNTIPGIENLVNFPPLRPERWQLFSTSVSEFPVSLIISGDNSFYPEGLTFTKNSSFNKTPYTVDISFTINPVVFNPFDVKGLRKIIIKNCVVVNKPYLGFIDFENELNISNVTGTFSLTGGLVFEEDDSPYILAGAQATLDSLIHLDPLLSSLPTAEDAVIIQTDFTWKPNSAALVGYNLITIGCVPVIDQEKTIQNSIIIAEGLESFVDKIQPNQLPNVNDTIQCINAALTSFRTNISALNAAKFQTQAVACLNDLKDQCSQTLCAAVISAISQFKSTVSIDPNLQFTTRPIIVSVLLKDPSGTVISTNLPETCAIEIVNRLTITTTFGTATAFVYQNPFFISQLTSEKFGSGTLTVQFDDKVLSTITAGNANTTTTITEINIPYSFIDAHVEPAVRRNESDVSP